MCAAPYDVDSTDPYTVVMTAIWTLLAANDRYTVVVPPGNWIRLDQSTVAANRKPRHSSKDLPEVKLEPAGGEYNPAATSDTTETTQIYRLTAMGGNLSVDKNYFPAKWAIQIVLSNIDKRFELDYVTRVQVVDAGEAENEAESKGWNFVYDIIVTFGFDRAIMKAIT
jgi:hypothetical protein